MKTINKILNIILISYFTSLFFLITACICLPARSSVFFQIFLVMTEFSKLIIAIIFVILVSRIGELINAKKEIKNYKEVN